MVTEVPTPADKLRSVSTGAIWAAVLFFVTVSCGIFTPWAALIHLLENEGVGYEGASILLFVAGYTLPLTLGTGVIVLLFLRGAHRGQGAALVVTTVAIILVGAGFLAQVLGLGLLPDYTNVTGVASGPLWLLSMVLQAYFNSYGWTLALSATMVGFAGAVHIERWMHDSGRPEG